MLIEDFTYLNFTNRAVDGFKNEWMNVWIYSMLYISTCEHFEMCYKIYGRKHIFFQII